VTFPLVGQLALARSATDRAAEHRQDDAWLARAWADPRTKVLRIADGKTLVGGGAIAYVSPGDVREGERYLLGVDPDGTAFFAVLEAEPLVAAEGATVQPMGLREVGSLLDDRDAGLLVLSVALANWHRTHTHCPLCGTPTVVGSAGFTRTCPADGSEHYPRTDPAMIVLVTDTTGERALLGSSGRMGPDRYSTLAGFVEPGESAEAAVIREVMEEARVLVEDVTYLGSQPWPFPSSLMLGFRARAVEADVVPQGDGTEILHARWFSRDELTTGLADGSLRIPPPLSIARRLIEHWYGGPLVVPGELSWS